MNIDVVIATTASLVIARSSATWPLAGAIMEDETGLMNAKADTTTVAPHFFLKDQLQRTKVSCLPAPQLRRHFVVMRTSAITGTYFLGLDGSSGPSQSTISTLLSGIPVTSGVSDDSLSP